MIEKKRLDALMVERGLEQSRERAKALIMSGVVYVNDQKADSAGQAYPTDVQIEVRGHTLKYVSRGGLKLEKALDWFRIDPADKIVMDVGASTGGFTDCLLQRGAQKVYAVDVGYGQLAWSVRTDPRVVCMERCNIRYVTPDQVPDKLDLAVIDVSFISLRLVLPAVQALLKENAEVVALIKPQFEAGREKVGKKGVVREASTHIEVIESTIAFAKSIGFGVKGLTFSPIRGPEGNIEFLVWLSRTEDTEVDPAAVVAEAHSQTIK
ncbi:MAG: TlyA family RNA methyltransferase [Ruminococcaceae bacterium]|jgi:23S rRNA (cytidine1920-2'-O)/16S rRNA (cytidine1409-2'-O)-methyltransferase|nr:TlyA family RNA methyltransferase [Oscillospiraceae bacterium]